MSRRTLLVCGAVTLLVIVLGAAAAARAGYIESAELLPPPVLQVTPGQHLFFDGAVPSISDLQLTNLQPRFAPPLAAPETHDVTFDVSCALWLSGVGNVPQTGTGTATLSVQPNPLAGPGGTALYPIEVTALAFALTPAIPGGLQFRASPGLDAAGHMLSTPLPDGTFDLDTMLYVHLEMNSAAGPAWAPGTASAQLVGVPEPATAGLLLGALAWLPRRRRRA